MDPHGAPVTELFSFDPKNAREDGWIEQSINWDDAGARNFTLCQLRDDGNPKFPHGLAVIPRATLDRLSANHYIRGRLTYERKELLDNPYHGNILLAKTVPKLTMRRVAASLALESIVLPR